MRTRFGLGVAFVVFGLLIGLGLKCSAQDTLKPMVEKEDTKKSTIEGFTSSLKELPSKHSEAEKSQKDVQAAKDEVKKSEDVLKKAKLEKAKAKTNEAMKDAQDKVDEAEQALKDAKEALKKAEEKLKEKVKAYNALILTLKLRPLPQGKFGKPGVGVYVLALDGTTVLLTIQKDQDVRILPFLSPEGVVTLAYSPTHSSSWFIAGVSADRMIGFAAPYNEGGDLEEVVDAVATHRLVPVPDEKKVTFTPNEDSSKGEVEVILVGPYVKK